MLSETTLKSNYYPSEYWECTNFRWIAKDVSLCDTAHLIRECRELNVMWESGIGDDDAIERRMMRIKKELKKRGLEV